MTRFDELLAKIPVDERALKEAISAVRMPTSQYIIYMTPRTGSSWLRDLLRSTDVLGWPEEWFNTTMLQQFGESLKVNSLEAYATLHRGRGQSSNGVYGTTITWHDISALWPDVIDDPNSGFLTHFPARETHAFALYRRDIVAQAVSLYRMMTTRVIDRVNYSDEQQHAAEEQFYYNELGIRDCIERIRSQEKGLHDLFDAHGIRPKTIVYEDIIRADNNEVVDFFVQQVAPGSDWQTIENAASRHKRIGSQKSSKFAARFRFDHSQYVQEIQQQRDSIFEDACLIEKDTCSLQNPQIVVRQDSSEQRISIVIPVYSALASTKTCLTSVISDNSKINRRILVIYDAGPNPDLEKYLDDLADLSLIELYKNSENRGFVASVNRGFDLAESDDVVILNSDTEVPPGWLDRMAAVAASDPLIATITPYTNNGEICSFPNFCESNDMPNDMSVAELDALFARYGDGEPVTIPTGVGFCMYVARSALDQLGTFNEDAFGRGYGEENDFCRRAVRIGLRNVLQRNLFVFHKGGASFGDERSERIKDAVARVEKLNPGYNFEVQSYVMKDPERVFRFEMVLRYIYSSENPIILIIAHGAGGGTRRYIEELRTYFEDDINYLWVEPARPGWIRLNFPNWADRFNFEINLSKDKDTLMDLLKSIGIDVVHVNHVAGIEALTFELIDLLDAPYIVTLHDYYLIGRNPTLTNDSGEFVPEKMLRDLKDADESGLTLEIARNFLAKAANVWAPSKEAAAIYEDVLPDIQVGVFEHIGTDIIFNFPPTQNTRLKSRNTVKICAIGALGIEKGADTLESVAVLSKKTGLDIEFELLGYAYRNLDSVVKVHGPYKECELQAKLKEIAPDIIWFPCRWPETYSYTLTAALESGIPISAPELGAFKSRTIGRPFTWIYDHTIQASDILDFLRSCIGELDAEESPELVWLNQVTPANLYTTGQYWSDGRGEREAVFMLPSRSKLSALLSTSAPGPGAFRKILYWVLLKLRGNRLASRIWFQVMPNNLRSLIRKIIISGR
ncbi:MAG: Stf0 family sulfotransferase [Pseudomonadota bacterium]